MPTNFHAHESRREYRKEAREIKHNQSLPSHGHANISRGRTRPNVPITSKFKTEMCHHLKEYNECPFSSYCTYAHSPDVLRFIERHPKHKTQLCRDFNEVGYCSFGERCSFIHHHDNYDDLLSRVLKMQKKLSEKLGRQIHESKPFPPRLYVESIDTYSHFEEGVTDSAGDDGPRHSDPIIKPLEEPHDDSVPENYTIPGLPAIHDNHYLRPPTASSGYHSGFASPLSSPSPQIPGNSSFIFRTSSLSSDCDPWMIVDETCISPMSAMPNNCHNSIASSGVPDHLNSSIGNLVRSQFAANPHRRLPVFRSICAEDDGVSSFTDDL